MNSFVVGIILVLPMKIFCDLSLQFEITNISNFHTLKLGRNGEYDTRTNNSSNDYDIGANLENKNQLISLRGSIRNKMAMRTMLDEPLLDVVCSPMALITPLAEMAIGCRHKTEILREIEEAIGFTQSNVYKEISKIKNEIVTQDLKLASQIFLSHKYMLQQKYKEEISRFQSEIRNIDVYHKDTSVNFINEWVRTQTKNVVRKIALPSVIESDIMLLLISSIYFQNKWKNPFMSQTTREIFHSATGPIKHKMMYQTSEMLYTENKQYDVKVVEVPIEKKSVNFLILLPNQRNGLTDLLKKIAEDASIVNTLHAETKPTLLDLKIPKFRSATLLNLKVLFKSIGLNLIFDPAGGMTEMVKDATAYVSKALQRVVIDINEAGVSITPDSKIRVRTSSKEKPLKTVTQSLHVDHPFVYYVTVLGEQVLVGIYNGRRLLRESKTNKKRKNKITILDRT